MNLKEQLIKFLETYGTNGRTYVEIYNIFDSSNTKTNKQKSDFVRGILRRMKQQHAEIQYEISLEPIHEVVDPALPKILVFDIETAPLNAYLWGLWGQNVQPMSGKLQSDYFMLTWAAKWLFEDKIFSDKLKPKEAIHQNDKRISKSLWKIINEADVIIGHNILGFDIKKMNTRFLAHNLGLPSPCQTIDTYKHAKKTLSMTSNKLDYIAKFLGLEQKIKTSFSLWDGCVKGNKKALKQMEKYNKKDIIVSEEVYLKLRPYIKPHPNLGLYIEDDLERCPTCLSKRLDIIGTYRTSINTYDSLKCKDCKSISRSRKGKVGKEFKKSLILSTSK